MQPFKVGQKVVCVNADFVPLIEHHEYVIESIVPSQCKCEGWEVQVSGVYGLGNGSHCAKCNVKISSGGLLYFDSKRFAPLDEPKERIRYVAVSETLRETAVEIAAIKTN